MKINNEGYTTGNIVDLLKNNNTKKANFKTSFFDTLNKSTQKYQENAERINKKNTSNRNDYKNAVVIDLNKISDKGIRLISEFERFLKNNPKEDDFNDVLSSIKDILNNDTVDLAFDDISIENKKGEEEILENLIALFVNYNNATIAENTITESNSNNFMINEIEISNNLEDKAINTANTLSLSSVLASADATDIQEDNIVTNDNLSLKSLIALQDTKNQFGDEKILFNKKIGTSGLDESLDINDIENIEDILDSTENEFSKIINDFGEKNINIEESKSILKKLLELSKEQSDSSIETIDNFTKKEDIHTNINNLITSSMSLEETNFNVSKTNIKNPIVNQVLESIYSQLSNESLSGKTIELRLKLFPSNLGKISVVIEKNEGSLNIKILSDNPEVRDLFLDSIQDLKLELTKNNLNNNINIDISNNSQNEQKQDDNHKNTIKHNTNNDYIENIAVKISSNNYILDKILDIRI